MAPEAARQLRKPSWRDPRLGVGVILVALSVALGTWAVASAGRTVTVWSATRTITPGESFEGAILAVDVSPNLEDLYLSAPEVPTGVADRVIESGELIPISAAVPAAEVDLRSVVVPVGVQISAAVTAGSRVDVWLNPDEGTESRLILGDVLVRGLVENGTGFVATSQRAVEILVAPDDVAGLLTALNDGGPMVVVPRSGE